MSIFSYFGLGSNRLEASNQEIKELKEKINLEDNKIYNISFDHIQNSFLDFETSEWVYKTTGGERLTKTSLREYMRRFYLEEAVSDFIDYSVKNNWLASKAYTDHLTLADTDLEVHIKLTGQSEEQSNILFREARDKVNSLYSDCTTDRDVNNLIFGYLLRYGAFASQKCINPDTNELEEIRIMPIWSLRWQAAGGHWLPVQCMNGRRVFIPENNFLYRPLFPIVTDKGKSFIPPLLAGMYHIPSLETLDKSLDNIGLNAGFQRLLKVFTEPDSLNTVVEAANRGSKLNGKEVEKTLIQWIQSLAKHINSSHKNSVVAVPPGVKVESLGDNTIPKELAEFRNILASNAVTGFKSYLSTIGVPGAVNQTTLSDTQKKMLKGFVETVQQTNISIYKHDSFVQLGLMGLPVEEFTVKHRLPQLEGILEEEQARALKFEQDAIEQEDTNTLTE